MIPLSEPVLLGARAGVRHRLPRAAGGSRPTGSTSGGSRSALADYVGVEHAVACNCGTSALHVSLMLAGVRPDDEVIVPTVTFIAPVNAVRYVGALPVFVDCDEYCNIDVAAVGRFLAEECSVTSDGTTSTAQTGDGSRRSSRCTCSAPPRTWTPSSTWPAIPSGGHRGRQRGARLPYKGRMCGGLAPIGCLSFNGNKIVTSGGGGAILTDDDGLSPSRPVPSPRRPRKPGIEYIHHRVGYNYRMNNVLAASGWRNWRRSRNAWPRKRRTSRCTSRPWGQPSTAAARRQPAWSDVQSLVLRVRVLRRRGQGGQLLAACLAADIQARPLWYPDPPAVTVSRTCRRTRSNGPVVLRPGGESSVLGRPSRRTEIARVVAGDRSQRRGLVNATGAHPGASSSPPARGATLPSIRFYRAYLSGL